jgi:malonate-semialdehyde dehydrogenase (acetylating)/methylmalonate-semialdehyde dehydrogenase
MTTRLKHFIGGDWREAQGRETLPVADPATQEVLAEVPFATSAEIDAAVASAKQAFADWREVPVPERARLMLRYQDLLKRHQDDIARTLSRETGKVFADAQGDVWRGIEVVEHACNVASLMMGETVENVARRIDTHSWVQPVGVCAGITPFNFPAMIPLWMFPIAIACGNTFVLKPSERDPITPNRLAELFAEAGAPKGVLQVVHGGREQVDALLVHPDVRAVSFVGSVPVGEHVYRTGTQHLKRVQALAGAKNHMVIMPDAPKEQVISSLVGSSCGAAGQRCMAISVAVFVGESAQWIPDLAAAMARVKPGPWDSPEAGYGPQITPQAKQRILGLIEKGKAEGAECVLDGSNCTVPGYPRGNWLGPTLFRKVRPGMAIYDEEIFGPVLVAVEVPDLDAAIALVNGSPYGNGTSIFTASGGAARKYQHEVEVGQVGINVPIPVPLPFFSFTGWRRSFFGDLHAYGKQAVRFYTETKTVTSRWFDDNAPAGPNMTIRLQ